MDETKETLKEKFKKLPPDVQEAILSVDLNKKLADISKKHILHIDQMTALENETMFIMLGLEHPSRYIQNIKKEMEIDDEKARKIAEDINTEIFRPIKESLKKIHQISERVEKEEKKSPAVSKQKETSRQRMPVTQQIERETFHDKEPWEAQSTARDNSPLTHEEILREVEKHANGRNTIPDSTPPPRMKENIVEEKLENTFSIPKTESEYRENESQEKKTKPDGGDGGTDPYREPIK